MDEINECELAICKENTFTDEQIMTLLTKGRLIAPEWLKNKREEQIQIGVMSIDVGGKPTKIILSCHDLVNIINYIAKEVLQ